MVLLNHVYTRRYPVPFRMPERRKCKACHFFTKLVAMATSLEISEKEVQIVHLHPKKLSFGEKIAKIGPADPEIIVLREIIKKKKERNYER